MNVQHYLFPLAEKLSFKDDIVMKYVKQVFIILLVSFLGEVLRYYIPVPVPAGVYGLVILFALLMTGIVKLDSVKDTASFLVSVMSVMFIPSAVGVMTLGNEAGRLIVPLAIACTALTFIVMGVSGKVADILIGRKKHE